MSEVGALIIKLQAETAQFRQDMGKVKNDLNNLKDPAERAGKAIHYSMREGNEAVIALGETFGVRLPSSITRTIAGLDSLGPALAAALPFAAIAVGAVLLIEHLKKTKDEAEKVAEAGRKLDQSFSEAIGGWNDKILQAREQVAKLNGNELEALHYRLVLIDHASLKELTSSFDKLGADVLKDFEKMDTGFWSLHNLMTSDSGWGASEAVDRLHALQEAMDASKNIAEQQHAALTALQAAQTRRNDLEASYHKSFIPGTKEAIGAYDKLIPRLQQMVELTKVAGEANSAEKGTAVAETYKAIFDSIDKRATAERKFYDERKKLSDESKKKGIEESASLADAQMKALQEYYSYARKEALLYNAEQEGLARVNIGKQMDALESSHALGLMSEQAYLEQLKTMYTREHEAKVASLQTQIDQTSDPDKKLHLQEQLTQETIRYNSELSKTETALTKINSSWQNYFAKMKSETLDLSTTIRTQMQSSITQFTNSFSQSMAKCIVENRSLGQATRQIAVQIAESWLEMAIKRMITDRLITASHIAGNETQVASDKTAGMQSQLAAAKAGAAKAYQAMAGIPIIGPELGVVAAAAAFSFMMAFEQGGKIPGQGAVPIIGHGGETVVTKALTDRVEAAESRGGNSYGDTHVHASFAPTIHAVDAEGVDRMLTKHGDTFKRHMTSVIRRMNK